MITNLKTNPTFSGYIPVEEHALLQVAFATANSAFRKEAIDELKGFDIRLGTGEDIDLSIRLSKTGWKLYFQPSAIVFHKHRHELIQLLKQWYKYGTHHPYLFKKHHPKRAEIFKYKRKRKTDDKYGIEHLFGLPFPFHTAIHLSDFYYAHGLWALFIASLFPFGPNPLSLLSLTGSCFFGARHHFNGFDVSNPKRSTIYVLLRYLLNLSYISGGFIGGLKNGVLFLDFPREHNPLPKQSSVQYSDMGPSDPKELSWLHRLNSKQGIPLKGINYDAGMRFDVSRTGRTLHYRKPPRTPDEMKSDFLFIRDVLGCNSVRIHGTSKDSIIKSSEIALQLGLTVLASPRFINTSAKQTAKRISPIAKRLETIRKQYPPGRLILLCANEVTLDLRQIVPGDNVKERHGAHIVSRHLLNKNLKTIVSSVRANWSGLISYATTPADSVNWRMFDLICLNMYMNTSNQDSYNTLIKSVVCKDRPVLLSEFGFVTNNRALELGSRGYCVVDWNKRRVTDDILRSEGTQADALCANFQQFEDTHIKGTFVYNYAEWAKTHHSQLRKDLDTSSFGIMKVLDNGQLVPKPAATIIKEAYKSMSNLKKESVKR